MPIRREKWTRLDAKATIEAPRVTRHFEILFVSPGGMFIPADMNLEPYTQVTARFTVEDRAVVAHAEAECDDCGVCVERCPWSLNIPELLPAAAKRIEDLA